MPTDNGDLRVVHVSERKLLTGQTYVGKILVNEWTIMEEGIGLNFVEVMEGGTSEEITSPLHWADMVELMANQRQPRSPLN